MKLGTSQKASSNYNILIKNLTATESIYINLIHFMMCNDLEHYTPNAKTKKSGLKFLTFVVILGMVKMLPTNSTIGESRTHAFINSILFKNIFSM